MKAFPPYVLNLVRFISSFELFFLLYYFITRIGEQAFLIFIPFHIIDQTEVNCLIIFTLFEILPQRYLAIMSASVKLNCSDFGIY